MGFLTDEVLGLGYIHEKRFSTVQWLSIAHAANCKCLFAKETSVTFINYKLRNPRIIKYQDSISRPDNILPILPVSFPVSIQ